jgi:hypothetical protein
MSQHRLLTVVCVFAALLAFPKEGKAAAGIIEIIIEMSGPQMLGFLVECRVPLDGTLDQWTVVGKKVAGQDAPPPRKLRFALEGGVYVSTGHDVDGLDYEFGKTYMLAFDPMLEIETVTRPRFAMYHGVMGASYNFLFGEGFRKFANVGFKLRPIGVVIANRVDLSYNLRLYPNGFTADQFGMLPLVPESGGPEAVHGIVIGYRW